MAAWSVYEANAVWVERDTYIMSVAYKWQHEKQVTTLALPDYPHYKKHKHCDKKLSADLWRLLDEANIVIAHNAKAFDIKKINSRLAVNGYSAPSSYKIIDTLTLARKVFKFDSNKLDNLGRYLGEGRKIPNTGAALWRGCWEGNRKSWRTMKRYNAQDVRLLERVYNRLKPWDAGHPNLNLYTGRKEACPTCQSRHVVKRGFHYAKSIVRQQWHCRDCFAWFIGDRVK